MFLCIINKRAANLIISVIWRRKADADSCIFCDLLQSFTPEALAVLDWSNLLVCLSLLLLFLYLEFLKCSLAVGPLNNWYKSKLLVSHVQ